MTENNMFGSLKLPELFMFKAKFHPIDAINESTKAQASV